MTKINVFFFFLIKPKKCIKSKKYADLGSKLGKLVSTLLNITKMGKMQISEKFMIIFTKTWTEKRKLS